MLVTALLALALQNVWTVDDTPATGPDFATIGEAIAGSAEGDFILVKEGDYPGFSLLDRSAYITADEGAKVSVDSITVRDIDADEVVAIIGIDADRPTPTFVQRLGVKNSLGKVHFQDCDFLPDAAVATGLPEATVIVADSAGVVFTGSRMTGSVVDDGGPLAGAMSPALVSSNSQVYVHDAVITGADGLDAHADPDGGDAVSVDGGRLYMSGCQVTGGQGGDAGITAEDVCIAPGDGGDAVATSDADAQVWVRGWGLVSGPGGQDPLATGCGTGALGEEIQLGEEAELVELTGIPHPFVMPRVIRENTEASITLNGLPENPAKLYIGDVPIHAFIAKFDGILLAALPQIILDLGEVPKGGQMTLGTLVRDLPEGVDALPLIVQSAFAPYVFTPNLGDGGFVLIIDEQY